MLILSAICHFVRITLFVVSTPPGSSTEHVFSYSDKMKTATAKVGGIMQNKKDEDTRQNATINSGFLL